MGSALFRRLQADGYSNLIVRAHSDLDLTKQDQVEAFFQTQKPEYVFLAAAKVGGIMANLTYPAEFIYTNLAIQNNIIHAAWKTHVKRLLFLGSSCIYPKQCPQPMKEDYLLTGALEPTNEPYAIAKIAGIKMCQSYNRQYGTRYICVMPTNLYGPNDNFDLETSHVLPALIRKFHLAKLANRNEWKAVKRDQHKHGKIPEGLQQAMGLKTSPSHLTTTASSARPFVPLWGSGNPRREFLHVDDLADACLFLTQMNKKAFDRFFDHARTPLINIGCGEDQTVRELATIVAEIVGYHGDVRWDQNKPDGTSQKLLDISKITQLGWKPKITLKDGIRDVYKWYVKITDEG